MRTLVPTLDAQARAENDRVQDRLAALLGEGPPPDRRALAELRRQRREGAPPFPAPWRHPEAVDDVVDGPGGPVPIRVLSPPTPRGAYLHITGGGWCTGAADINDQALWAIATEAEVTVVCASPRLAPEHPFPAPVDDTAAVLQWLLTAGAARFGTDRFALGGDSTGAHLALLAALVQRDAVGRMHELAALNLAVGIYDLTPGASWRTAVTSDPLLSPAQLARYVEWFAPEGHHRRAASPLHLDLRGLAPMLVTAAGADPLGIESGLLASAAEESGVHVTFVEYPGASHGFATFETTMARGALGTQARFLAHHLTADTTGAPR